MISCIWCEDAKRGIGKDNKIPWRVKEDMQFFKEKTMGSIIVMGRKTFESLGSKALIDRTNVVLTNNKNLNLDFYEVEYEKGMWTQDFEKITINRDKTHRFRLVKTCYDPFELVKRYRDSAEEIFIIGGKKIYDYFLPYAKTLYVSKLKKAYDCDVFMTNSFNGFEIVNIKSFDEFELYEYKKVGN